MFSHRRDRIQPAEKLESSMDTQAAWESGFQDAVHESDPMIADAV